MASVWGELKRRNVVRVAIAYAIASWLLLQLANILIPVLTLPEWVERLVFLILLLGFPLAMFFAWAYELTPDGLKKEKHVDRSESVSQVTGRKLDFIIIAILAAAVVFFVFDKYVRAPASTAAIESAEAIVVTDVQHSIAVLPFVNMSSDPEQEFFSDGLSEEILNLLAKVPDLKVIARTSSFAFKGKNEDLRIIGEALDVRTVLEGSVRKSGDRVRITAQLIDVSNGAHLWSETYDHTLTDIFAVQDQVASEILDALQIHVGVAPKRGRPTESTEAYSLFLKAKGEMNRWNPDTAEVLIMQALELDPEFAEAWETLAYAYWEQWGNSVDADTATQRVEAAASKALAINPNLIFAKYLLGSATTIQNVLFSEINAINSILRVEPNHGPAQELKIYYLTYGGYLGEALQMAERLVESDPLSPNALFLYNQLLFATGRKGEAFAALELAERLGSAFSKGNLAFLTWEEGRYDISLAYQKEFLRERSLSADWVDELHRGASEPSTGQAHLDRRIPEIVKTVPPDRRYEMNLVLVGWYLTYGFLDRYFEEIIDRSHNESPFSDAEVLIFSGQVGRGSGFTTHPSYLQVAKAASLIDLWESRGPPDFCSKASGEWVCE